MVMRGGIYQVLILIVVKVKGTLSSLRQFLQTKSPLKLMKNAFYFNLKYLFVPKIFTFFGHVGKRLRKIRLISNS